MAGMGRFGAQTAMTDTTLAGPADPQRVPWFSLKSFRAKFILVVGAAVVFDLLLAGGVAVWNVNNLSRDAAKTVGDGLTEASREYLDTYIEATARRADLLLSQVHSEVTTLANSMQVLIDNPATQSAVTMLMTSPLRANTPENACGQA